MNLSFLVSLCVSPIFCRSYELAPERIRLIEHVRASLKHLWHSSIKVSVLSSFQLPTIILVERGLLLVVRLKGGTYEAWGLGAELRSWKDGGRHRMRRSSLGWSARLRLAGFYHVRHGKRLRTLLEQLSERIGGSIPFACQDWAATKAAY
jgi:Transposase DNA-binding